MCRVKRRGFDRRNGKNSAVGVCSCDRGFHSLAGFYIPRYTLPLPRKRDGAVNLVVSGIQREGLNVRKVALFSACAMLVMAMALTGCATSGGGAGASAKKGVSDQDAINQALASWKAGMEGKDVAKLGSVISDSFSHYEWGNKQQMLDFLKSQFEQGTLDGAKIDLAQAKTKIENGVATVYPVSLTASFGTATIEFTLAKEADGSWRATKINVEGV